MELVDTLICARWVLPIEPDGPALPHHAVAVKAGRIVALLPVREARARFDATEIIERPDHVLMPGLVNAHTHGAMTLLRGRAENLTLASWLTDAVWPIERRWIDPEYVRDGTELAIAEMLRGGVTCFADMHLWPEIVARTAAEVHMRASVGLVVVDAETRWGTGPDDYIEKGMALRDEYRGDPLIGMHFAPHAPYTVDDATLLRVRRLADELEIPVGVHLHESAWEIEASLERHGMRPLARLAKLGLASPLLVAIHMTHADDSDLEILSAAAASVVHCPESNLKLGSGICPVAELLARGVPVALGTDGAASNNDLDLFGEMRTAGLLASGVGSTPGALVPRDLLRMATLEGARALGLGDCIGSLVPGKWADMCCVNLRAPRTWPMHDLPATLVYSVASSQVTDTWVAGRQLFGDGTLRYIDEGAVLDRATAWCERIDAGLENATDAA